MIGADGASTSADLAVCTGSPQVTAITLRTCQPIDAGCATLEIGNISEKTTIYCELPIFYERRINVAGKIKSFTRPHVALLLCHCDQYFVAINGA